MNKMLIIFAILAMLGVANAELFVNGDFEAGPWGGGGSGSGAALRSAAGLNYTAVLWCVYFLVMIILAPKMVSGDSDLVLHICYGRSLLENGFLKSDPLLSGITGAPMMQEWGFDIIVALLDRICGLGGPLIVFASLFATLVAWLFHRMRKNSCFWLSMLYTNLMFFALSTHLVIRGATLYFCA